MDDIVEKSGLSKDQIDTLITLFMENITILSDEEVKANMEEGKAIMKDIDIKDAPILACALSIPNDGIWSTDKHFQKQSKVKVWSTEDLKEYI